MKQPQDTTCMLIILLPAATLDFSTSLVYARRFFFGHLAMYALHLVAKTYVVIFQAVPMHFDLVVHANSALHLRFKLCQISLQYLCIAGVFTFSDFLVTMQLCDSLLHLCLVSQQTFDSVPCTVVISRKDLVITLQILHLIAYLPQFDVQTFVLFAFFVDAPRKITKNMFG